MTDNNNYTGVTVKRGLAGVRQELSMYLGSTGVTSDRHAPRALTQMAQEIISNSRDEIVAGYGDMIRVVIHPDQSMSVSDKGRGLPKGPGDSFEQVINSLTEPHASGKFSSEDYAASGVSGLHGIGVKAVNAGSRWVTVDAVSHCTKSTPTGDVLTGELERYHAKFEQDKLVESWCEKVPSDTQTGTTITFLPDDGPISETKTRPVFESIVWTNQDLERILESTAFLMPATRVSLTDERGDEPTTVEWFYENGLSDYVTELTPNQKFVDGLEKPIQLEGECEVDGHMIGFRGALAFIDDPSGGVYSYANGVPTRDGGPHVDGFKVAVVNVMNSVSEKLSKKKRARLIESDVMSGLICAFEVRVPGDIAAFESQTKEKLGTTEARRAVKQIVEDKLLDWLFDNEPVAQSILDNATINAESRVKLARERQNAKAAQKAKRKGNLVKSSKLKDATSRNPEERELYIVEGDSASNIGRNPRTQAVFPIRGKIINVEKADVQGSLKNTEVSTIVSVIGAGFGPTFDINDVKYKRVILAADADKDGRHILMLLFTLFHKYMPELIRAGKLYILEPPLFRAEKYVGNERKLVVAYSDAEMRAMMHNLKGYKISRYKGLGQMEPDEAQRYIADPEHRRIRQITIEDLAQTQKAVGLLMGDDSAPRQAWIEKHLRASDRS